MKAEDREALEKYVVSWERYERRRQWVKQNGGAVVRELRQARGLTLREMAKELGVSSFSLVSRLERGEEVFSAELVKRLLAWDKPVEIQSSAGERRSVISAAPVLEQVEDIRYEKDEWSGEAGVEE